MGPVDFVSRSADFQWRRLRDVTVIIFNFLKFASKILCARLIDLISCNFALAAGMIEGLL